MTTLHEKYIVDSKGNKSAVILPIEEYNEFLEDIHDLTVIAERKDDETVSFDDVKKGSSNTCVRNLFKEIS